MERCDNCDVPGLERPLFTRITVVEGETVCLLFCSQCQSMSNEELRRKIHLWLPPYDRKMMGVGA